MSQFWKSGEVPQGPRRTTWRNGFAAALCVMEIVEVAKRTETNPEVKTRRQTQRSTTQTTVALTATSTDLPGRRRKLEVAAVATLAKQSA